MISGARHTLVANVVQQACAAALLLTLPNLLDKSAYAEIVFVGVLLSFGAFADLGLSLVYGRVVPALIARGDNNAVRQWDTSVLRFGLASSAGFSLIVAMVYEVRHGDVFRALLLLPIPLIVFWFSFHVSRVSAGGDFSEYRRVIIARASASLVAIPLTILFGLSGWFWSQLLAALLVLAHIRRRLMESWGHADWALVRRHLREGLMLCAITVSWLQLLNFGRLFASLRYAPNDVAHYGVAGSAYQALSTLLISAFLPVTVGLLRRFGQGDREAFDYTGRVLSRSVLWVLGGSLATVEVAPHVLRFVFPAYEFEFWMLAALLLGVVFYPFFILWGCCLIGKQRSGIYLALILVSLGASTLAALTIDLAYPGQGAAWGQLIGLAIYTVCLFAIMCGLFREASGIWRRSGRLLAVVISLTMLYVGLHKAGEMA